MTENMRWQEIWEGRKLEVTLIMREHEILDDKNYEIKGYMRWQEIWNHRKYERTGNIR